MESDKRVLTIFGATGNQGSGVINTVLAIPTLKSRYALRAVTRDPTSVKSQNLAKQGVEMVKAELNDAESLKRCVRGSYGVFGVTDYWSIHNMELEIQQGMNLFLACKAENVKHYVWSTLPWATKFTEGVKLEHLPHYESKALVQDHIEANKGDMIASYFIPGMFFSFIHNLLRLEDGQAHITLPYASDSISWPLIDPPRDGGKFIMGLFEAGSSANGRIAHAVSCWTTPKELVAALSKEAGREITFNAVSVEEFETDYPDAIAGELSDTLQVIGDYGLFGKGKQSEQAEHDKWLVKGSGLKATLDELVRWHGPWTFETTSLFDNLAAQKKAQQASKA